mmetsp:Transcript_31825/g.77058  ORF Transcript_31825/g.77058 Transcript_31825/m.77058 type:complete len:207 (-) Transcript_31825:147-767(-)
MPETVCFARKSNMLSSSSSFDLELSLLSSESTTFPASGNKSSSLPAFNNVSNLLFTPLKNRPSWLNLLPPPKVDECHRECPASGGFQGDVAPYHFSIDDGVARLEEEGDKCHFPFHATSYPLSPLPFGAERRRRRFGRFLSPAAASEPRSDLGSKDPGVVLTPCSVGYDEVNNEARLGLHSVVAVKALGNTTDDLSPLPLQPMRQS